MTLESHEASCKIEIPCDEMYFIWSDVKTKERLNLLMDKGIELDSEGNTAHHLEDVDLFNEACNRGLRLVPYIWKEDCLAGKIKYPDDIFVKILYTTWNMFTFDEKCTVFEKYSRRKERFELFMKAVPKWEEYVDDNELLKLFMDHDMKDNIIKIFTDRGLFELIDVDTLNDHFVNPGYCMYVNRNYAKRMDVLLDIIWDKLDKTKIIPLNYVCVPCVPLLIKRGQYMADYVTERVYEYRYDPRILERYEIYILNGIDPMILSSEDQIAWDHAVDTMKGTPKPKKSANSA